MPSAGLDAASGAILRPPPHHDFHTAMCRNATIVRRHGSRLVCSAARQQLLRCGTSPYGNHGEVEAAESRKDFIHKLKVCLKELKETRRWLRLVKKAAMLPALKMAPILHETEELIMIFFVSIRTAEKNAK